MILTHVCTWHMESNSRKFLQTQNIHSCIAIVSKIIVCFKWMDSTYSKCHVASPLFYWQKIETIVIFYLWKKYLVINCIKNTVQHINICPYNFLVKLSCLLNSSHFITLHHSWFVLNYKWIFKSEPRYTFLLHAILLDRPSLSWLTLFIWVKIE
jgi:hypothetical protein